MKRTARPTDKPKILVVGLGGTWSMQPRAVAGAGERLVAEPLGNDFDFAGVFPQVLRFCEPRFEELVALDSSNLTPRHWSALGRHVRRRATGHDGVVILQGTDTLAYTAAAMAFALQGLDVPVVLSGAQIAAFALGSDAGNNVVNACRVAALRHERGGRRVPALRGVAVVFGSQIIDGARCRKMSENDLDAFASINAPPLGTIRREIELSPSSAAGGRAARRSRPAAIRSVEFDEEVAMLELYPGIKPEVVDGVAGRASGLVLAAFGAGNIPSSTERADNPLSLEGAIRRAVDRGVPVVVTTQCPRGLAEPGLYDAGARARAAGAIVANDMTTEAAFAKLSWLLAALGRPRDGARGMAAIRRGMLTPYAGEIREG